VDRQEEGNSDWSAGGLPMRRYLNVAESMDGGVFMPMASVNRCQ